MPPTSAALSYSSGIIQVFFSMPEGIPLRTVENELILDVIDRLKPYVDGEMGPGIHGYNLYSWGSSATGIFIYPDDPLEAPELMDKLRDEILVGLPGAKPFISRASLLNIDISGGRNIDIDLQGPELTALMDAAKIGQDVMNERFSDWSVRALPGTSLSKPELQLIPDDLRITQAGLDRGAVTHAILVGELAFDDIGEDLHVVVRVHREAAAGLDGVVVHDPQRVEAHVVGIKEVREGKSKTGIKPAVVGMAALVRRSFRKSERSVSFHDEIFS